MKKIVMKILAFSSLFLIFASVNCVVADDFEFNRMQMSFKNFVQCELTRTQAVNPFNGKPFKITMIDLFDINIEADMTIVTGAVECFVVDRHITLYVAVGLKKVLDVEQVLYYTIRDRDFSILATELIKYPYKERCKWSQYWIDVD